MMQLQKFEVEVLKLMINDRLTDLKWNEFISTCSIVGYEYTGSGYILKINLGDIDMPNEVIDQPIIIGKFNQWLVGFILFIEDNFLFIECHGWGYENPPAEMREFDYQIEISNLNK
ncbi:MAG TPA: hypothetical protein VMZ69_02940 [Saprospiraceae bacterium]|nr:hypothetical protein [Saprospiraceae bacterium]